MTQVTFATHRRERLTGLAFLYGAQGAPEGLLYVAVPAWLSNRGVGADAIGAYIAIILLPWSLKLINGLLMDRLTFLPMGRRRPWLIGAQTALVLCLVIFGIQAPIGQDLAYVTTVGFLVNLAAAFQDVAIDGMAIDVVPDNERAQANGYMWGGKTLGIAGSSFANGQIISHLGYGAAALATASFVALVMLAPLLMRERPGERLLPWSRGEASSTATERQLRKTWPLVAGLFRAMIRPHSLLLAAGIFVALVGYGLHTAFEPVVAIESIHMNEADFGNLAAIANLLGGIFGIVASGWIARRLGQSRTLVLSLAGIALLQFGVGLLPGALQSPLIFAAYTIVHALLFVLMSVCIYAEAMAASNPTVSATQFSVFMAVLNLGTSFGARYFGPIAGAAQYEGVLLAAGLSAVLAGTLFLLAMVVRPLHAS